MRRSFVCWWKRDHLFTSIAKRNWKKMTKIKFLSAFKNKKIGASRWFVGPYTPDIVSLSRYSIPRRACCLGIRLKTDSCLGIRCLGIHSGAKGVIMLFMHLSRYSFEILILSRYSLSRYSQRGLGYYVPKSVYLIYDFLEGKETFSIFFRLSFC